MVVRGGIQPQPKRHRQHRRDDGRQLRRQDRQAVGAFHPVGGYGGDQLFWILRIGFIGF